MENDRAEEKKVANEKELKAEVRSALSEFTWAEGGKDVAFDFYVSKAARNDAGDLVIGDMPLGRYIKEHVPRSPLKSLLTPRAVGGSGADKGQPGGGGKGAVELESIKPGAKKEDLQAAANRVAELYKEHRSQ